MLKIEAQLDGANYEDLTDRVERCRIIHGGSTANPDRPDFRTATGTILLTGQFNPNLQRVRCRVYYDTTLMWSGFIQEPQRQSNRKTRWTIAGLRSGQRAQKIGVTTPAIRASDALDFTAITSRFGTITKRNLPTRQLKEFRYEGPISGLVSRLGLLNSAEIIENKTGNLIAANPHLTVEAQGRTISAATEFVLDPSSKHIASRIRNTARVTIPPSTMGATEAWTTNIDLPEQADAGPITASFTIPTDNASYASFAATATAEVWLPTVVEIRYARNQGSSNTPYTVNRGPNEVYGWYTVPATIALGAVSNGMIPITVTLSIPTTFTQILRVSAITYVVTGPTNNLRIVQVVNEPAGTDTGRLGRVVGDTEQTVTTPTVNRSRGTVILNAQRRTTATVAGVTYKVNDAASVALWGERELDLPDWVITNRARGGAAVTEQIEGLANLRREHRVTLQIDSPSSLGVDAGDYVLLRVNDVNLNITVNAWCLVVGREIRFGDGVLGTVTLTCLETALAASQAPGVPQNLAASAVGADVDLRWLAPVTGGVPTRYEARYRQSGETAWSSPVSLGLAFTGTITGLTASTLYEFQLRAVNASGESNWSATVMATTQAGGNPTPPPASTVGDAPTIRFRLTSRTQYWYSINRPSAPDGYSLQQTQWRVQKVGETFTGWMTFSDWIRLDISTYGTTPQSFIVQARHQWRERGGTGRPYSPIGAIAGPPSSSEQSTGPEYLTLDGQPILLQDRLLEVDNTDDL